MKFPSSVAAIAFIASMAAPQAMAATTGLDFAGGCPHSEQNIGLCDMGGNADVQNVAAILGVSESLVSSWLVPVSALPESMMIAGRLDSH